MITIKLKHGLDPHAEQWLAKNIGPRMHYIHNSIGGKGWIAKSDYVTVHGTDHTTRVKQWHLTLEDERFASFFLMMFPQ